MDAVNKAILQLIQKDFPLVPRPYERIGELVGVTEYEAFNRIETMRQEKIIRRIGGVFDSAKLGYTSTLCAAKVPESQIEALAQFIAPITEITHNYLRGHEYNIWFTIIANSDARLNQILQRIRDFLGSDEVYSLPSNRKFKVSVFFDMLGGDSQPEVHGLKTVSKPEPVKATGAESQNMSYTEQQKKLIRLLQETIPSEIQPFKWLSQAMEMTEDAVLEEVLHLKQSGAMKRFGSVLYHQKAGFGANAMGVWQIPDEQVDQIGTQLASSEKVSHCYSRPPIPRFDFNLFTMVHGKSDEECRMIMKNLSEQVAMPSYDMLFSIKELKKSSMKYFVEAL